MTATIVGDVDLDRDSLFLGILKKGESKRTTVTVSTVSKGPLEIDSVDSPLDYLSVDITPKIEGKGYLLTATLTGDAPAGNIKSEVIVHTNDPDQPEINIPVHARVEKTKPHAGQRAGRGALATPPRSCSKESGT